MHKNFKPMNISILARFCIDNLNEMMNAAFNFIVATLIDKDRDSDREKDREKDLQLFCKTVADLLEMQHR